MFAVLDATTKLATIRDPASHMAVELNAVGSRISGAIRFDRATADPGKRLVIEETVTTLSANQISEAKWDASLPKLRDEILRSNAGKMIGRLEGEGILVVFRFNGKDGQKIGDVAFSPTNGASR